MKIIFNPNNINQECVIAIGNFDGVHLGHQYLLGKAKEIASKKNLPLAVMTFEPHPLHLFRPALIPARITSMKTKLKLLEQYGADICFVMKFNQKFSEISAQDFISNFLAKSHVVTGYDFSFGHSRAGDSEMLKSELGANYTPVAAKGADGQIFSSSVVRGLLKDGAIAEANKILGHEYIVSGKVVHGKSLGAELGYPTANILIKPYMLRLLRGVYLVKTQYGFGVANYGVRPSFGGGKELLEVHLLDFDKDIYGEFLQVNFLDFIREEMKFDKKEKLQNQIKIDIKHAEEIINNSVLCAVG